MFMASCEERYTPKARAYFRINYPEHSYQIHVNPCGFSFELPVYAEITADNSKDAGPCWHNIHYLPFNAKLHLSFMEISDEESFFVLTEEARDFVYRHSVKASEISENLIVNNFGSGGMYYELEGNTASAIQFFVTDSTKNFLRGALYFDGTVNRDSLDPVIDFLKTDIEQMIKSFRWTKSQQL